jgi:hypothetical protein
MVVYFLGEVAIGDRRERRFEGFGDVKVTAISGILRRDFYR